MPPKGETAVKERPTEQVDPTTGEVTTVAEGQVPAELDYGADIGAGYENQTSDDVSIPFLSILQPNSAEVSADNSPFKGGMILNKTTGEVYLGGEGVEVIPAYTRHVYVEWVPRDKGGGYVGEHAMDSGLIASIRSTQPFGDYKHPQNGNDIIETFYVYGVALDKDGSGYPCTMAFTSTHIKPYQDWMFRARSIVLDLGGGRKQTKLPLFSHVYRVKSRFVEKGGNKWYVPEVAFARGDAPTSRLAPTHPLYEAAKGVHQAVSSGTLRAATETLSRTDAGASDGPGPKGSTSETKAPY